MNYLFTFLCFFFVSCHSQRHLTTAVKITEGIEGWVREIKGNQMPSQSRVLPPPKGISTVVYVYELTNINETERVNSSPFYKNVHTKFIQSVLSDSSGHFIISLAPGDYSLFTKVKGVFYSNSFDVSNNISPVKVEKDKLAKTEILISAEANF